MTLRLPPAADRMTPGQQVALDGGPCTGHLVIIGGRENRKQDMAILERFVALAGGPDARLFVLTAASRVHDEMWALYERAFTALGVRHVTTSHIASRDDACRESTAVEVFDADGIFVTGGDQKRLMSLIGGTRIDHALHRALRERGACIGGTSAGASAMSEHMLFDATSELLPQKGTPHLGAGLGLVRRVIIDQHFSERQRLGRLLSVVAQNPYLLGAGIDENTALIVRPGHGLEVIGAGAVTLVDGREMASNLTEVDEQAVIELADVRLHLLPAGVRHGLCDLSGDSWGAVPGGAPAAVSGSALSAGLRDAVEAITSWCGQYGVAAQRDAPGVPA